MDSVIFTHLEYSDDIIISLSCDEASVFGVDRFIRQRNTKYEPFLSPAERGACIEADSHHRENPSPRPSRRVLICVRGQCAESNRGFKLEQHLLELIRQHGLDAPGHPQHTTCTVTNCLGVCTNGPIIIVHPEAIKYQQVDRTALERIFHCHLLHNQPVEELRVKQLPAKPILKKGR
jgi:(2Fe-2S) ferredoxin